MSRSRLAAMVVLAALVGTLPADAAPKPKPKPQCNTVKDPKGDAFVGGTGTTTYDPSLDIISADVNANAKMLTAVIRLADLTEESQWAPAGRTWTFAFTNGANPISLSAYQSELGGESFGKGTGTFDYVKNEIRIHVPIGDLAPAKVVKGTILRGFNLTSNAVVGLDDAWNLGHAFQPLSGAVDRTDETKATFKVGSLSCVVVGK